MTGPLRVLLVDDEELARLRLRSLVADCSEVPAVVVGEAANAAQAVDFLMAHECDLLLLPSLPRRMTTTCRAPPPSGPALPRCVCIS